MAHLYVWDRLRRKLRVVPRGGNGEGEGGDGGQGEGGSGSEGGSSGGGGGSGGEGGDDGATRTFTQDEVSNIAAREKAQGRQAAENQLAEDLGVPIEEAREIIEQHRQREEAEKTEAQKAREAADREKAEAEQAKAEAARERHDAKVERALLKAGVNPDILERATPSLNLEVGADDAAIKAEIDALKKDVPSFFGTGNGKPPSSTPGGTPPSGGQPNKDAFDKGAERAKALQGRE